MMQRLSRHDYVDGHLGAPFVHVTLDIGNAVIERMRSRCFPATPGHLAVNLDALDAEIFDTSGTELARQPYLGLPITGTQADNSADVIGEGQAHTAAAREKEVV